MPTARLLIRRFTIGDLDDFLDYQADPEVRRYLLGEPMTPAQAAEYLTTQATLDDRVPDAWHARAVHHVADDRVIGDLGIWLPARDGASPDIGFQFHPAYHGKGYAHEAVRAYLHQVFETLAPARITATCAPANTASQALMKRLGLRLSVATADKIEYDLTHDQWRAMAGGRSGPR
ncbi:GNAT family N-acetyltransferase [Actinoplanes sp. N902-109]|uniref:GNAT family N-acetyltransferase n=1 Tax=Actinoplanes sp. (strain N902-109) TaxID=649831 RepID=UPI0003294294|nr:GNAT family N-acetyltransferase [Actinoplanes sp. N902-109]AGL16605.1 acetyltransferase [Actinoplanes sp. N902-109]